MARGIARAVQCVSRMIDEAYRLNVRADRSRPIASSFPIQPRSTNLSKAHKSNNSPHAAKVACLVDIRSPRAPRLLLWPRLHRYVTMMCKSSNDPSISTDLCLVYARVVPGASKDGTVDDIKNDVGVGKYPRGRCTAKGGVKGKREVAKIVASSNIVYPDVTLMSESYNINFTEWQFFNPTAGFNSLRPPRSNH